MNGIAKPPLYLINGPLGAGKTTLLKFLLSTDSFSNARVIENEFASADVDAKQLEAHRAEVRSIAGVCICCSTGRELSTALEELAEASSQPVIIEASGVASSLALIEKLSAAQLFEYYNLQHAIFVLDAAETANRPELLDLYKEELAAADTVLLSKTDLLEPEETLDLMQQLSILRDSPIESMFYGEVNPLPLQEPSRILDYYLNHEGTTREHDDEPSYAIITTRDKHVTPDTLRKLWQNFVSAYGAERMKGAIRHNEKIWHIDATPSQYRAEKSPDQRETLNLVIIGTEAQRISDKDFE